MIKILMDNRDNLNDLYYASIVEEIIRLHCSVGVTMFDVWKDICFDRVPRHFHFKRADYYKVLSHVEKYIREVFADDSIGCLPGRLEAGHHKRDITTYVLTKVVNNLPLES